MTNDTKKQSIEEMSFLSRSNVSGSKGNRRRSESVSALGRVRERRRHPTIDTDEHKDVATLVCIELSRALLTKPELDLGVFLKTAANSRRDLSISDATMMISVAILDHIGNSKAAAELLSRSATITGYYKAMGLDNKVTRELLVTILFALSPDFVKMIETAINICVTRSAENGRVVNTNQGATNALISLASSGAINSAELIQASTLETALEDKRHLTSTFGSVQTTPTDMIAPSDSASVIIKDKRSRAKVNEADLRSYARRRRSGPEPEFGIVFPSAEEPVILKDNKRRHGIGYKTESAAESSLAQRMNELLGSASITSYKLSTGEKSSRRPRVEDFLDSESIATTTMKKVPDIISSVDYNYDYPRGTTYEPTETHLLDTTIVSESTVRPELKTVDSTEELMRALGLTG